MYFAGRLPFSQTGDTGRARVAEGEDREPEEELVESRGGRKAAEWRTRTGSGLEVLMREVIPAHGEP